MKKFVFPTLLVLAVFLITIYCQRFTILRQEGLGLFLLTPDFFRDLLFDAFPLSNLAGSFLVQFYSNFYVGAAIVSAIVVAEYFIAKGLFRRFGLDMEVLGVACACAAWIALARAANPSMGMAIIFCSLAAYAAVSLLFRKKVEKRTIPAGFDISAGTLAIAAVSLYIFLSPFIKEGEKWSKIEFAAVQGEWKYLLRVANVKEAERDIQVVPFALLALNAQGRLADEVDRYPIMENFGLDFGDEMSYRRSLFDAVLYNALGCYNEAIHRTHQCGDFLPHCTSFRTLRMLVKENHALGDSLMVVKYCDILDRSLSHREFVGYFRNNPCPQRTHNTPGESAVAPLIVTKDPMGIMLQMGKADISNPMVMDRYYAYYKVREFFTKK
ncbi:MAG: hypothetical protein KBS73_00020 [Bacteroidales bacterium]|nr:hypothetical protein [Candidatus Cacconaster equifaecalis]